MAWKKIFQNNACIQFYFFNRKKINVKGTQIKPRIVRNNSLFQIQRQKRNLNKKSRNVKLTVTTSVLLARVISNQNAIRTYTKERNDIFEQ